MIFSEHFRYYYYKFCFFMTMFNRRGSFPPADGTTTDHNDSNSSTVTGTGRRALKHTALSYSYAFPFPLPTFIWLFTEARFPVGG